MNTSTEIDTYDTEEIKAYLQYLFMYVCTIQQHPVYIVWVFLEFIVRVPDSSKGYSTAQEEIGNKAIDSSDVQLLIAILYLQEESEVRAFISTRFLSYKIILLSVLNLYNV